MDEDKLWLFETVKEITGYLTIQGNFSGHKSLGFFKNLEIISGRDTDR